MGKKNKIGTEGRGDFIFYTGNLGRGVVDGLSDSNRVEKVRRINEGRHR